LTRGNCPGGIFPEKYDQGDMSGSRQYLAAVADRPDPPVEVELRRCSSTVAEVTWQPGADNNEPILHYVVQYRTSTGTSEVRHEGAVVDADARSAVIPLRPWANYSFRVSARNRFGVGPASRPTSAVCSTPPTKPFRNPTGVCSNLTSSSQLVIIWQVCRRVGRRLRPSMGWVGLLVGSCLESCQICVAILELLKCGINRPTGLLCNVCCRELWLMIDIPPFHFHVSQNSNTFFFSFHIHFWL